MSKYKGLFTFDVDNHKYLPVELADGIITDMNYHPEKEPLIKDKKIRKAVRAWWNIQENPFECAAVLCKSYTGVSGNKDHDGYYNYCIYGYVQSHNINKTATGFEFRTKTFFEYDRDKDYTIAELCGKEE